MKATSSNTSCSESRRVGTTSDTALRGEALTSESPCPQPWGRQMPSHLRARRRPSVRLSVMTSLSLCGPNGRRQVHSTRSQPGISGTVGCGAEQRIKQIVPHYCVYAVDPNNPARLWCSISTDMVHDRRGGSPAPQCVSVRVQWTPKQEFLPPPPSPFFPTSSGNQLPRCIIGRKINATVCYSIMRDGECCRGLLRSQCFSFFRMPLCFPPALRKRSSNGSLSCFRHD